MKDTLKKEYLTLCDTTNCLNNLKEDYESYLTAISLVLEFCHARMIEIDSNYSEIVSKEMSNLQTE